MLPITGLDISVAPRQTLSGIRFVSRYTVNVLNFKLLFCFSLGSTRFFKVARVRSQEGLVVVKVFAIHDPTLPLSMYRDRIEEIRSKLASANNCLPCQRVIVSCSTIYFTNNFYWKSRRLTMFFGKRRIINEDRN